MFPEGYNLNLDKTICTNLDGTTVEGVITSDGNNITVTSNKTIYCYLYFDLPSSDITINVLTNGINNTLPTTSGYRSELVCNDSNFLFNNKYQRIEISSVNSDSTICNLNYIEDVDTHTSLISEVVTLYFNAARPIACVPIPQAQSRISHFLSYPLSLNNCSKIKDCSFVAAFQS